MVFWPIRMQILCTVYGNYDNNDNNNDPNVFGLLYYEKQGLSKFETTNLVLVQNLMQRLEYTSQRGFHKTFIVLTTKNMKFSF